jgi:hypothetical protein
LSSVTSLSMHGRPNDKPSSFTASTSPKTSSVSPQQRSLLLSQQTTGPLYHLPQLLSPRYVSPSGSGAVSSRASTGQDVSGSVQRQTSMAAAATHTAGTSSYGRSSQATSCGGTTAYHGHSLQPNAELGYSVGGRHSTGL